MDIDPKKLDNKVDGDEALAKEFFLNLKSAHALEEIESVLLSLNQNKYVKFSLRDDNFYWEGNVFLNRRLQWVRGGDEGQSRIVETEFGLLIYSNGVFTIRLNDVKESARVYKRQEMIAEMNNGRLQVNLEHDCYMLEFNKQWYVLDFSLEEL